MKLHNVIRAIGSGWLAAVAAGMVFTVQAQPVSTNQIALTDFDTFNPGWSYGYYYSWGWGEGGQYTNGTFAYVVGFNDPIIPPENGPLVLQYTFTNEAFAELVSTNPGAGYGTGFGSALMWDYDYTKFSSTNLEDYIVSFDARVEGLAPGQTTGNVEMQIQIFSAVADPPLPNNRALQKNFPFNPGSNWTHFTFTLNEGYFGEGTTYQSFVRGVLAGITSLSFNNNLHMPHAQFGFDGDNAVYVDNIRLQVVQYEAPPPVPPTEELTILDWNMDDKPLWFSYGGYNWSQNSYLPTFTFDAAAAGVGVGGSNGWILRMDNSALAPPNTPAWAGGGTGGGGPVDYSRFMSGDLKSYRITFDARAEGLNPAREIPTICRLQLFLDSPNGNMRLDFEVPAETNWTTTSYLLNQGNFGMGSKSMFATNYNTITALRTQWQIENAHSEADWSYDNDNALIVDNIKLVYLAPACPPLQVTQSGANIIVTWAQPSSGTAKLQSATTVTGPYTDVPGATSPYTTPVSSAPKYFRTIWVPPAP